MNRIHASYTRGGGGGGACSAGEVCVTTLFRKFNVHRSSSMSEFQ